MKLIAFVFTAALLLNSPAPARADESSKNAKIDEMMRLTHADRMITQMFEQMKNAVKSQMPKEGLSEEARKSAEETQAKVMDLIAARMSWDRMRPAFAKIYSETFSESEIDGIIGFYKSPAGQAMLEKMPLLIQKSMGVSQELMRDVGPEIERMVKEMKEKH